METLMPISKMLLIGILLFSSSTLATYCKKETATPVTTQITIDENPVLTKFKISYKKFDSAREDYLDYHNTDSSKILLLSSSHIKLSLDNLKAQMPKLSLTEKQELKVIADLETSQIQYVKERTEYRELNPKVIADAELLSKPLYYNIAIRTLLESR